MKLSWFGDFFSALPEALQALYEFGDPESLGRGWWGFLIVAIWGVFLVGIPIALAKRWYGEREWLSAMMGVIAATAVSWWIFGIIPSAWIYYVDANKEILEGVIIPASFTLPHPFTDSRLEIMTNLYDVLRDVVVLLETNVAVVAVIVAAARIQQRYPRTLAPGEIKPEAGGYK